MCGTEYELSHRWVQTSRRGRGESEGSRASFQQERVNAGVIRSDRDLILSDNLNNSGFLGFWLSALFKMHYALGTGHDPP